MLACLLMLLCISSVPILTAQEWDSRLENDNNEGLFYEANTRIRRSPPIEDTAQYFQHSEDASKSFTKQIAQSYVAKPEEVEKDFLSKDRMAKKDTRLNSKKRGAKTSAAKRIKRGTDTFSTTDANVLIKNDQPLEVKNLESAAISPTDVGDLDLVPQLEPEEGVKAQNVVINDYIRFRRNAAPMVATNSKPVEFVARDGNIVKEGAAIQLGTSKRSPEEPQIDRMDDNLGSIIDSKPYTPTSTSNCGDQEDVQRSKREPEGSGARTARMLMEPEEAVDSSPREPRGPTTTQWVKNRYPIDASSASNNQQQQQQQSSSSDSTSSASDTFRAPRVHFVTQRRSESSPPPVIRPYEREGRARDVDRDWRSDYRSPPLARGWRDYDRFVDPPMPSYYRRFEPRYDPYYRPDDFDRYDRYDLRRFPPPGPPQRSSQYDRYDAGPRSSRNNNRIIYYATLPEVSRRPPPPGYRGGQRYDPYAAPSSPDGYRYRKSSYYDRKGGYEQDRDRDGSKVPYPVKVAANVNVRDTKKNPELRIYSETDRSRYAYKAPGSYQAEESYNNRQA